METYNKTRYHALRSMGRCVACRKPADKSRWNGRKSMELPKMVWMKVDLDNNELPLEIADSAEELAKICGVTESTIRVSAKKARLGGRRRYVCVWIADV